MHVAANLSDNVSEIFLKKAIKIFEGELFIRSLSTTVHQIFCKFMLHSKVFFKSITVPDGACQVDFKA